MQQINTIKSSITSTSVDCCVAIHAPLLPRYPHSFESVSLRVFGWLLCPISIPSGRDSCHHLLCFYPFLPRPFSADCCLFALFITPDTPRLHAD